jgi:hypothetical protein
MGMRKPYLTTELAIIRQLYFDGGAKACQTHMPHRSLHSIRLFARKHGIRHNMAKLNEARRKHISAWKWHGA